MGLECRRVILRSEEYRGDVYLKFTCGKTTYMSDQSLIKSLEQRTFPDYDINSDDTEIIPGGYYDYYCWTKLKMSFTPEESGLYYIGITINNVIQYIQLDDLTLYTLENAQTVADFTFKGGFCSATEINKAKNLIYLFPGDLIYFTAKAEFADTYKWNTFGEHNESEENEVSVKYDKSGLYSV